MEKSQAQYHAEKVRITKSKKLSESEKSTAYFNNWNDYIFSSIPHEARRDIVSKNYKEIEQWKF
jgi:hypothetical protein